MGTITININGDDKLSPDSKQENVQAPAEQSSDGGAPGFENPAISSAQLDIGGPPQWLTEALSKEAKAFAGVSAAGALQGIDDGDAGAAKASFN